MPRSFGAPLRPAKFSGQRDGKRTGNVDVRAQFFRTEFCRYNATAAGCRNAEACPFAHGNQEIQHRPDLTKTSMCRSWMAGECRKSASECPFAHGRNELRITQGMKARKQGQGLTQPQARPAAPYKEACGEDSASTSSTAEAWRGDESVDSADASWAGTPVKSYAGAHHVAVSPWPADVPALPDPAGNFGFAMMPASLPLEFPAGIATEGVSCESRQMLAPFQLHLHELVDAFSVQQRQQSEEVFMWQQAQELERLLILAQPDFYED